MQRGQSTPADNTIAAAIRTKEAQLTKARNTADATIARSLVRLVIRSLSPRSFLYPYSYVVVGGDGPPDRNSQARHGRASGANQPRVEAGGQWQCTPFSGFFSFLFALLLFATKALCVFPMSRSDSMAVFLQLGTPAVASGGANASASSSNNITVNVQMVAPVCFHVGLLQAPSVG
jgi:hypothetical protein